MGPGDLSRVLAPLGRQHDPRLLIGHETFDDAGIFALSEDVALVQTLDFFAPIVDDPFTFGQVAAANALSDIYAMGGEPLTAMNIVGFPVGKLPLEVLTEILRGGQEKVHEAGAVVVGGHSVTDDEVKYGLSVTGRVDPRRLLTNAAARPGDVIVLSKPLGTGILSTAVKGGDLDDAGAREMLDSMTRLNREASRAALAVGARCATDVTGFGLLGHLSHVARASGVTLRVRLPDVPVFAGVAEAWAKGARTGGGERNADFVKSSVEWGSASELQRAVLTDPQTSGGLLVAVPAPRAAEYLALVSGAVAIGEVLSPAEAAIVLA